MGLQKFDYSRDFAHIDFRKHPEKYQVGKGEQGVLLVEPYKSEILPYWRFKTPEIAQESSLKIRELFYMYKTKHDFVGMDMARKFLQMGYTRSRRYANHASGRKYDQKTKEVLPQAGDALNNQKAESARIFYERYQEVNADEDYQSLKKQHQEKFG